MRLSKPEKLVYSPHTYGPSVYTQAYFKAADFPANMPKIWTKRFAYLAIEDLAPVIIGEMGGFYDQLTENDPAGLDKQWQDWAVRFMADHGIGVFYFAMNPGSVDTGGLLGPDFTEPQAAKLKLLEQLPTTDVLEARARSSRGRPPPPNPDPNLPPPMPPPRPTRPPPCPPRPSNPRASPPPPPPHPPPPHSPPPPPPPPLPSVPSFSPPAISPSPRHNNANVDASVAPPPMVEDHTELTARDGSKGVDKALRTSALAAAASTEVRATLREKHDGATSTAGTPPYDASMGSSAPNTDTGVTNGDEEVFDLYSVAQGFLALSALVGVGVGIGVGVSLEVKKRRTRDRKGDLLPADEHLARRHAAPRVERAETVDTEMQLHLARPPDRPLSTRPAPLRAMASGASTSRLEFGERVYNYDVD